MHISEFSNESAPIKGSLITKCMINETIGNEKHLIDLLKELAESNSICPKNCAQCKKSNADTISICIKCGNGYDLKGSNDNDEIICVESSQLTIGFYQNLSNSVYYPCISNCDQCENGNTCQTCSKY